MNARHPSIVAAVLLFACGEAETVPTIHFTSPVEAPVHVRDSVTLQLVASTADVLQIELRRNGHPLANLVPPFQYVWDTRSEPEGPHELIAYAVLDENEIESPPLQVLIDRTAPRLESVTPAPFSQNIWPMDPVTLTFSEPLDPRSLAGAVKDFIGEQGRIPAEATLSEDGTTLTLVPSRSPGATIDWRLELAGLRDLAGNRVDAPQLAWRLPRWQRPTSYLDTDGDVLTSSIPAAIALDANAAPVVAFLERHRPYDPSVGYLDRRLHVKRWSATGWVPLADELGARPDDLNADPGSPLRYTDVGNASMVLDANSQPVIAWTEENAPNGPFEVHVARWNGSRWLPFGESLSANDGNTSAGAISVALAPDGHPVVAFVEQTVAGGTDRSIYVRRWDGTSWQAVNGPVNNGTTQGMRDEVSLDVGADGTVAVAFTQRFDSSGTPAGVERLYVVTQRDTRWDRLSIQGNAAPGTPASRARVRVDGMGNKHLVWTEQDGSGGSQVYGIVSTANGTGPFFAHGLGIVATGIAGIDFDHEGRVVFGWIEDASVIHLERWNNGRLEKLADGLSSITGAVVVSTPSLAVSPKGVAAVAFMSHGREFAVEVARTAF